MPITITRVANLAQAGHAFHQALISAQGTAKWALSQVSQATTDPGIIEPVAEALQQLNFAIASLGNHRVTIELELQRHRLTANKLAYDRQRKAEARAILAAAHGHTSPTIQAGLRAAAVRSARRAAHHPDVQSIPGLDALIAGASASSEAAALARQIEAESRDWEPDLEDFRPGASASASAGASTPDDAAPAAGVAPAAPFNPADFPKPPGWSDESYQAMLSDLRREAEAPPATPPSLDEDLFFQRD